MTVTITDGWLTGSLPDDTGREWPVVQRRQESKRGPLRPAVPNLILHTTETDRYLTTLKYPSQWQCGEARIGQHIKLGLAGDAVNNWDVYAQQIEMVGRSQIGQWLPEEATLGPVVALVAWLHSTGRIKTGLIRPKLWPIAVDQLPAAVTTYYRRLQNVWPDEPGVYGHIEIPDNSHWDPGGFDYPRFFARVQKAIEGDDDVSTQDMRTGGALFRQGKPLPTDANADTKYGYNLEKRIDAASKMPAPTVQGPHVHNLVGKAE
jgi:hypothetical protein